MRTGLHEQYLGKPWALSPNPPESFNCGELVRWIYKERLGIASPLLIADTADIRSCIRDIQGMDRYGEFFPVEHPQDYDIALMARGAEADHIGLCVGSDILHCRPKVGVFLDDLFTLKNMGWRRITFLRMKGELACTV